MLYEWCGWYILPKLAFFLPVSKNWGELMERIQVGKKTVAWSGKYSLFGWWILGACNKGSDMAQYATKTM